MAINILVNPMGCSGIVTWKLLFIRSQMIVYLDPSLSSFYPSCYSKNEIQTSQEPLTKVAILKYFIYLSLNVDRKQENEYSVNVYTLQDRANLSIRKQGESVGSWLWITFALPLLEGVSQVVAQCLFLLLIGQRLNWTESVHNILGLSKVDLI